MNSILHQAATRGHANHGWLDTYHTFSFAQYYDPQRIQFGALRVLNDDTVSGGMGFDTHPHDNMEIITIPLLGSLRHQDNMGNVSIIGQNDVQAMSAGTGIYHSEYNHNIDQKVNFLQIWILPKSRNIKPRYSQLNFNPEERINKLQPLVCPDIKSSSHCVVIHQDAWFSRISADKDFEWSYPIHRKGNGTYFFLLDGSLTVEGQPLSKRDGLGTWDIDRLSLRATEKSDLLILEVPMA